MLYQSAVILFIHIRAPPRDYYLFGADKIEKEQINYLNSTAIQFRLITCARAHLARQTSDLAPRLSFLGFRWARRCKPSGGGARTERMGSFGTGIALALPARDLRACVSVCVCVRAS